MKSADRLHILVFDLNQTLREKVSGVFSRFESIRMTTQVSDFNSLFMAAKICHPDFIVMDFSQAAGAPEMIGDIRRVSPRAKIILYTDDYRREYGIVAMKMGADALVDVVDILDSVNGIVDHINRATIDDGDAPVLAGSANGRDAI